MKHWQRDKAWSDRFLPEIKQTLGLYLIGEPPIEEDAERNTDLMVLRMDAVRIACRVRQSKYVQQFGDEFTIRSSRPSGVKTELAKIIEGWGDYFFYAMCQPDAVSLERWVLGDLRVFRVWHSRQLVLNKGQAPGQLCHNRDGSSSFRAYKVTDIRGFVIASNWLERQDAA